MRGLILAGAILITLVSSANAWTQSILYPEGQGASAVVAQKYTALRTSSNNSTWLRPSRSISLQRKAY